MNNLIDVHEYMHALGLLRMPRDCVVLLLLYHASWYIIHEIFFILTISLLLSFMIELLHSFQDFIWIVYTLVIIVIWNGWTVSL